MSGNAWVKHENGDEGGRQRQTRWLTPRHVWEALGEFDLDPAGAPDYDIAERTYLPERGEDGLTLPWEGRVWLNPPYGKEAEPFLRKMAQHGHGTSLVFARTETKSFRENVWEADSVTGLLFLHNRLTFIDADGIAAKANAGAPSVLVAYGMDDFQAMRYAVEHKKLAGTLVTDWI